MANSQLPGVILRLRSNPIEPVEEMVEANGIELQQLRATLRLCFRPEQADSLASRLATDEVDAAHSLAPVVRMARASYSTTRWLAPIKARSASGEALPLRPRLTLPAVPALALAFHLGLDLDIETLAQLFGRTPNDIAMLLQRARRAVDATHVGPCPEFVVGIGRYRDPGADRFERLALMQHLEGCSRCQLALDHARATDEQLLETAYQFEQNLSPVLETHPSSRPLWLGPALFWGGVAVAALLVVAVIIAGSHRLLSGSQTPVPLLATTSSQPAFGGWLLETSQTGDVEAVSLTSGVHRLLIQGDSAGTADTILSPDRQRIAEMSYTDAQLGRTLRVFSIDGVNQHEWTGLDASGQYRLDGWLNADELLVSYSPARKTGETETAYNDRLQSDSTLLAFDVRTGDQHTVLHAQIDAAYASPDGQYVALKHVAGDGTITLDLRQMQGGQLGDPIASVPRATLGREGSPVLWTLDSRRLVFWARASVDPATNETPIDVMTVDGKITAIHQEPGNAFGSLLGISPDGTEIVYAQGATGTSSAPWAYWRIGINGGTPMKLIDGGNIALVSAQRTWSPIVFVGSQSGNAIVLTSTQPFYLPQPQQGTVQASVTSYVSLAFDSTGKSLGPLLDQFTPDNLLTWLPENALPPVQTSGSATGPFRQSGRVAGMPALTANSRVSPDGSKVLTYDAQYQFSMAVLPPDPSIETPQLVGAPDDPSWLPDSSGVIGVQRHTTGSGSVSRIAIYGTTSTGNRSLIDFDPAELGQSTVASYHHPLLSPDGLHGSFFVVDRNIITLWVGSYSAPPKKVSSWVLPGSPNVQVPLIASWASSNTLIFAEPDDWVKGFPRRVSLERVTVAADGGTSVEQLIDWTARGGEKGVLLQDLRLSPDRSQLALRLRRLTGTNLTTDRFDSITVSTANNLEKQVEIARGVAGEGMSWSPDGMDLTAFIDGHLEIVSSDGKNSQAIETGNVTFAYPVWVRPNEIWYQAVQGNGQSLNYTLRATR